jgi:hypothetical protein
MKISYKENNEKKEIDDPEIKELAKEVLELLAKVISNEFGDIEDNEHKKEPGT